jgi:hypothetical protein
MFTANCSDGVGCSWATAPGKLVANLIYDRFFIAGRRAPVDIGDLAHARDAAAKALTMHDYSRRASCRRAKGGEAVRRRFSHGCTIEIEA